MRSKKITDSARGEQCTINIAGVCSYDPETVVYCHLPDGGKGMGIKSSDLSGAYGCYTCHQVIDGHARCEDYQQHRDWYLRRAQTRTLERLLEKGILRIT